LGAGGWTVKKAEPSGEAGAPAAHLAVALGIGGDGLVLRRGDQVQVDQPGLAAGPLGGEAGEFAGGRRGPLPAPGGDELDDVRAAGRGGAKAPPQLRHLDVQIHHSPNRRALKSVYLNAQTRSRERRRKRPGHQGCGSAQRL
jgi:hypothetical protein